MEMPEATITGIPENKKAGRSQLERGTHCNSDNARQLGKSAAEVRSALCRDVRGVRRRFAVGDLIRGLRIVLIVCVALTLGYLAAHGLWAFLVVSLLHAAALAPMTVLADALALGSAAPPPGSGRRPFEYGWVRGTGSAAFIVGTLASGQFVSGLGLGVIVVLQASLLGAAALAAVLVPELVHHRVRKTARAPLEGVLLLLRIPLFRNLIIVAALILGSHAMHDAFAVIRWSAAGVAPAMSSLLWSESVAAEVLVFFVIGPALVTFLTPAGAVALAALAGALRWTVVAQTADLVPLALVQPLHGITFALLHLACTRIIARTVPDGLEGTAQALYGTVAVGGATALLTFFSGALYAQFAGKAFLAMAALCAIAFPLTRGLRQKDAS